MKYGVMTFMVVFCCMGCQSISWTNYSKSRQKENNTVVLVRSHDNHILRAYPKTEKIESNWLRHGTVIKDDYQWLENGLDTRVQVWTEEQLVLTRAYIDPLPQRTWLVERLTKLWRYDDRSIPRRVLDGERIFFWTKRKDDEHWVYHFREKEDADQVTLLNPNEWDTFETLDLVEPSRDGTYLAFGKARRGDENTIIRIMEVGSGIVLPDTLKGWRQRGVAWMPDNSGFFYTTQPVKGEVTEGEEFYWSTVFFHRLGTPADQDEKVFGHDTIKEYFHQAVVSEDGKHLLFYRASMDKTEVYIRDIHRTGSLQPLCTGLDARYLVDKIGDRFYIMTDKDNPLGAVFVADLNTSGPESWKLLIPQSTDNLDYITFVAGKLFAVYTHQAHTRIKIFDLDGTYLRDMPLPTLGSAVVHGNYSQPDIWVGFSSFTYPSTQFTYDVERNELQLHHRPAIDIDVSGTVAEQVWYNSKDGTPVSMFLVHRNDIVLNGNNPVLLTGYGGFSVSMTPNFSTLLLVWLEAGGMVAIPNLRGGGEYGEKWHLAGTREKKQNVFDDFIAAAEWLIARNYTNPDRLAIAGGSNGGLLVGAAMVQRPELFAAVSCSMPLLDMLRYHLFGLANIWSDEYGNSDDPEAFRYLAAYSPYHNVREGVAYPAILLTGSEDDARTDPLHARKMAARLQEVNPNGNPVLLNFHRASGHGGGTTLSIIIQQYADEYAFLMDCLHMQPTQP